MSLFSSLFASQRRKKGLKCTHKSGQKTRFRVFSKKERVRIMKISKEQREKLLQNPYVAGLSEKQIYYTEEFKQKALAEYTLGKTARQIFLDAGFELEKISEQNDYASKTLSKWRQAKKTDIHYPKKKIKENKSAYQKMAARLEYLEAENEFLKKLQLLIQSQK